ncbi:MAG: OmpA family protein [Saprospiraceae bacterium]|nr:OmpA family protein [Candidatus Opimibacter skivensis]
MSRSIFSMLLVMAATWLSAQPVKEVPVYMMIETAEASLLIPDYYTALEWYENAYKETRDPEIANKISTLQIKLRDYVRAEKWLEKIVEKDQGVNYPYAVFQYAQVLKVNGKYQESIDAFNFYAGLNVSDSLLALADNEVAGIQLAVKSKPPIDLVVKNVGKSVNYSYTDASPWLGMDGNLYFASMRTRELITLNGKEGDYYLKIYNSKPGKDGEWETAKPLDSKINREGYHSGNPSITEDGSRMFFTRSQLTGNDLSESKIFVSVNKAQNWGAPVELKGINGNYIAKQAAPGVVFGKEVLFFSSNMDGGFGGFDIYYADRINDETYGLPVNLGPLVNSPLDDETPFYLNNNLYFSSTGHPGLGGFDIFRSEWNGQEWGKPANLGAGYNSSYDDIFFSVNEDGKLGFLVSNRPDEDSKSLKSKTCCDDIYQFHIRDIVIDLITTVYDGTVPLPGTKVTVFEVDRGKTGKSQQQVNDKINDSQFPLDQDKAYKVLIEKEGYMPAEFEFNTVGVVDNFTVRRTIKLAKKVPDNSGMETVTINEPIRLNNIYYDFDDDKILPDAEKDLGFLVELMKKYPDMVIELSSHTDAQGNDAYNERLSQRRAQSAKNWMVSKGIKENRIEAVGYGEEFILNDCFNGIDCSDELHRVNRRTEFKIISGPTTIEVKKSDLGDQKKKDPNSKILITPTKGTAPVTDPKVELTFDKKIVELGAVKKGEKKEMSFSFTNTGNIPIEIELVTSCECTTLDWPQFKIFKPGEKGTINAVFDSKDKEIGETTDVEIILRQADPKTRNPMIYTLQYKFDLIK